jgi:hypothetical protein
VKLTFTNDSATIGTSEYSLPADSTTLAAQTDDCELQVWIDLSAMTAAEQYQVKVYEKVNAGSQGVVMSSVLIGVQATLWTSGSLVVGEGWDVTVKKLAGTDRSIAWSLRKKVEGETIVIADGGITAAKLAADCITAAKVAADVGTEIADAVAAYAHESGRTLKGLWRRIEAAISGKATGLLGSAVVYYRSDGSTAAITATQDTTAGSREAATVGGD